MTMLSMIHGWWNKIRLPNAHRQSSQTLPFQWLNILTTQVSLEAAIDDVVEQAQGNIQGSIDLAIVFISTAFSSEYTRLMPLLTQRLNCEVIIGCGGSSIIGTDAVGNALECEDQPALSLTVAHLPGVDVIPFHVSAPDLPDLDGPPDQWWELFGVHPSSDINFVLLSDPFLTNINDLLAGLDFAYPHAPKIGGLSSSAEGMSGRLFYYHAGSATNPSLIKSGTVGVALKGNIQMDTIVAQGCRPIGDVFQVTQCERNIITALATTNDEIRQENTPLIFLQNLLADLDDDDQVLAQDSLFIGIAMDEFKHKLTHGDFLIRNLLGVDPRVGAMAVGDRLRNGQRIQFHLRDAETSIEDLAVLLQKCRPNFDPSQAFGALMFTCLGRGKGLYGEENVDSTLFAQAFPEPNIGGFFCNGEIGPVGDRTLLHGYTSVFGIFHPKDD